MIALALHRSFLTRIAYSIAIAPLALGLAACGKEATQTGAPSGAAIAKIAPPAGKIWSDTVVVTPEGGYRMGNPNAPIKLIEFGSLTCSHCADFSEKSSAVLRDNFVASGRVSFEFRNYVRDAIDLTAAQLTQCGAPESFFALTDQAFANQTAMLEKAQAAGQQGYEAAMSQPPAKRGPALAELIGLTEFFAARGISRDQANACLADTAKAEKLAQNTTKQGEEFKIEGTPTFLINGLKVETNTWEGLKVELEKAGAR